MKLNIFSLTNSLDRNTQVTSCTIHSCDQVGYYVTFIVTNNEYRIESTVSDGLFDSVLDEEVGTWSGIYWENDNV